jgi:hypothetical protein
MSKGQKVLSSHYELLVRVTNYTIECLGVKDFFHRVDRHGEPLSVDDDSTFFERLRKAFERPEAASSG